VNIQSGIYYTPMIVETTPAGAQKAIPAPERLRRSPPRYVQCSGTALRCRWSPGVPAYSAGMRPSPALRYSMPVGVCCCPPNVCPFKMPPRYVARSSPSGTVRALKRSQPRMVRWRWLSAVQARHPDRDNTAMRAERRAFGGARGAQASVVASPRAMSHRRHIWLRQDARPNTLRYGE